MISTQIRNLKRHFK